MVQILPAKETFGAEFGRALGGGLGRGAAEGYQQKKESNQRSTQLEEENKKFLEMGIDLRGHTDPKMRQQSALEQMKNLHKMHQIEEKRKYVSELIGGKSTQNNESEMSRNGSQEKNNPQEYNPLEISDENLLRLSAENPQLANLIQQQKNMAAKETRANRKLELDELKASPEYIREKQAEGAQASADIKYNQELQESSKQTKIKQQTLDQLEKLNEKDITGKPYEKFLEKAGLVNLTSSGRREFAAQVKNLITDVRSILGGQFSNFEFQTILNAYPSADFSKEANRAIISNLKDFQDIKSKESEFAQQIKDENGGKIPPDFQAKVNQRVSQYTDMKLEGIRKNLGTIIKNEAETNNADLHKQYNIPKGNILMYDPNGEPLSVPEKDISRLLKLGAIVP